MGMPCADCYRANGDEHKNTLILPHMLRHYADQLNQGGVGGRGYFAQTDVARCAEYYTTRAIELSQSVFHVIASGTPRGFS